MRHAVRPDRARSVHTERHGITAYTNVVQELIEPALQKRRVYRKIRFDARRRERGAICYRMLLGNAYVLKSVGACF